MKVIVTPNAAKQYNNIPQPDRVKIKKKLLVLEENPTEGKKLSGEYSEFRSLRVWPYKIIYYIDPEFKKIFVVSIIHRQEAYK